jgi:hypothetical protein
MCSCTGVKKISHEPVGKDELTFNRPVKVEPFLLNIVPPSSGVQFYKGGIVFTSLSKNEGKMLSGHLSFGKVQTYYATLNDTIPGRHMRFSTSSFSYPAEAMVFTNDYKTMYFTKESEIDKREKIYHADLISADGQQGWQVDNNPLSFCRDGSSYSHPAISADGKFMIFSSDKSGSAGGMDLFLSRKNGQDWSDPVNLGQQINTKGNELFPCLDRKNNLYFSSDGLQGLGGYDIYISRFDGQEWEKPINIGKYFNSNADDIAFTINNDNGNSAFFTRRQKSRSGVMQLYRVSLNEISAVGDSVNLSGALYSMALAEARPEELALLMKERAEKEKADRTEAEEVRIDSEREKADSIAALKIETEKRRTEKIKADNLQKIKNEAPVKNKPEKTATNAVVYRIQISSSLKPKGTNEVSVNGQKYSTYEYLYLREYRTTIGEFSTLKSALDFLYLCRKSGYPNSFVVAFINNIRSNDPGLFKKP